MSCACATAVQAAKPNANATDEALGAIRSARARVQREPSSAEAAAALEKAVMLFVDRLNAAPDAEHAKLGEAGSAASGIPIEECEVEDAWREASLVHARVMRLGGRTHLAADAAWTLHARRCIDDASEGPFGDMVEATEWYAEFIDRYPHSDHVKVARAAILKACVDFAAAPKRDDRYPLEPMQLSVTMAPGHEATVWLCPAHDLSGVQVALDGRGAKRFTVVPASLRAVRGKAVPLLVRASPEPMLATALLVVRAPKMPDTIRISLTVHPPHRSRKKPR